MSLLWLGTLGLGLIACLFILWPMVSVKRQQQGEQAMRKQANITLFQQQQADLQRQLQAAEIDAEQLALLEQEAAAELLQQATDEKVVRATNSRGGVAVLAASCIALLLGAVWFYQFNGAEDDLLITQQLQLKLAADDKALRAGQPLDGQLAEQLLRHIEFKLQREPDNQQYLYLKANTAVELKQFDQAVQAYKAMIEQEESAHIMAELAQLLHYMMRGKFTPEIDLLLDKSLQQDPENMLALELRGLKLFQAKDYQGAIRAWGKVFLKAGPESLKGRSVAGGIQRARQLLTAAGGDAGLQATAKPAAKAVKPGLKLRVALAEGLSLAAEQTVFIYARAWQGAPMPLAIARHKVADLPLELELTDAMAMAPNLKLSGFKQLELIARVSLDGRPKAQKGDYQASLGPVSSADTKQVYQLLISTPI